jgi:hypothetical protein
MPATTRTTAPRRPTAAAKPAAKPARAADPRPARGASGRLPGWGELGGAPAARRVGRLEKLLGRVPTRRFVLAVVFGALAFTAYVGHVYATRQLFAEVQQDRREHLRLSLKRNRLKGELDGLTAPGVVVERARALGLVEGLGYGPTIRGMGE